MQPSAQMLENDHIVLVIISLWQLYNSKVFNKEGLLDWLVDLQNHRRSLNNMFFAGIFLFGTFFAFIWTFW